MRNATWIAWLSIPAFLIFSGISFAGNVALSESELSDLRFLHGNPKQFASKLDSKSPVVAALASAFAYREDPDNSRQRLMKAFWLPDYGDKTGRNHHMVSEKQLSQQLDELEKRRQNLPDRKYLLLIAFIYYQDRTEWMTSGKRMFSAARFFRAAFLAALYRGSPIDAVQLAHDIDSWAEESEGLR